MTASGATPIRLRHAVSPDSVRGATTEELRARHLVEDLFVDGELHLVYSFEDRMVIGGAVPTARPLALLPAGPVNTEHFLSRREAVILHVGGGPGVVTVDGERYELDARDCLFAGQGGRSVELASASFNIPRPSARCP